MAITEKYCTTLKTLRHKRNEVSDQVNQIYEDAIATDYALDEKVYFGILANRIKKFKIQFKYIMDKKRLKETKND